LEDQQPKALCGHGPDERKATDVGPWQQLMMGESLTIVSMLEL
jgi:hypothetical protein